MNKLPSTNTLPLRNITRTGKRAILLVVGLTLILVGLFSTINTQAELEHGEDRDLLAYVSDEGQLRLYNPRSRTETVLLEDVSNFVLGEDGRIAFTRLDENDPGLYSFDPATPDAKPITISQNSAAYVYPLGWSPDGRYLAFASFDKSSASAPYGRLNPASSDDQLLYVWDGEKIINVMPDNGLDTASRFYIDWSNDGRLAFTILYGWSSLDTPAEIYLWNGTMTTNLSQNPNGWDSGARWSETGKLMFGLQREEDYGVYIWDDSSFKDEAPNSASFVRLPPGLEFSPVIWANDGLVTFAARPNSSSSDAKVIILWDPEQQVIVKQYPVASKNVESWLAKGGQAILSSQLASGIPSAYLDVESIEGEILFSNHVGEFAWSSDGYLAYCGIEEGRSRVLSLWDGKETWVVARVSYKPVQWQYGRDTFSCNNG